MPLEIDLEMCTGCGDCVVQCPGQALDLVKGKPIVVRPDDCDYCTECELFCTAGAIRCSFEIILVEPDAS